MEKGLKFIQAEQNNVFQTSSDSAKILKIFSMAKKFGFGFGCICEIE